MTATSFLSVFQIFFYSVGIFENAKVKDEQIPMAVIGTNAVNVLMTLVAVSVNVFHAKPQNIHRSKELSGQRKRVP